MLKLCGMQAGLYCVYAQEAIIVDALTDIGGAFASYVAGGDGRTRDGQQLFAKGRLEERAYRQLWFNASDNVAWKYYKRQRLIRS